MVRFHIGALFWGVLEAIIRGRRLLESSGLSKCERRDVYLRPGAY